MAKLLPSSMPLTQIISNDCPMTRVSQYWENKKHVALTFGRMVHKMAVLPNPGVPS